MITSKGNWIVHRKGKSGVNFENKCDDPIVGSCMNP